MPESDPRGPVPTRGVHIPNGNGGDIDNLATLWNNLGEEDPMWAVLTQADKKGGRWAPGEFFAKGRRWVNNYLAPRIATHAPGLRMNRALDFGCGVGRVTQALAEPFDEVHGVDIAQSMIEEAERYNRYPGQVIYHCNQRTDLGFLEDGSFDFVHTVLVLQHMPSEFALGYLAEFGRILRPGGWMFFQVPTSRADGQVPGDSREVGPERDAMQMFVTPMERIEDVLRRSGVGIAAAEERPMKGGFESHNVLARRQI